MCKFLRGSVSVSLCFLRPPSRVRGNQSPWQKAVESSPQKLQSMCTTTGRAEGHGAFLSPEPGGNLVLTQCSGLSPHGHSKIPSSPVPKVSKEKVKEQSSQGRKKTARAGKWEPQAMGTGGAASDYPWGWCSLNGQGPVSRWKLGPQTTEQQHCSTERGPGIWGSTRHTFRVPVTSMQNSRNYMQIL